MPLPAAKAFAGLTFVLTKTDLALGEVRDVEKNITLHSCIITTDNECRKIIRGWREMEATLLEWISDEGSGLDLYKIKATAHIITVSLKLLGDTWAETYLQPR